MDKTTVSTVLRILSDGVNPDTGESLPEWMSVYKKKNKDYLLNLASEIENIIKETNRRAKAKARLWTKEEVIKLGAAYKNNKPLNEIAEDHGCSESAIAYRLIEENIVSEDVLLPKLAEDIRLRVIKISQENETRKHSKMKKGS